jgi:hypothetical protein
MGNCELDAASGKAAEDGPMLARGDRVRKAQALVRQYVSEGVPLVDQLIGERRSEDDLRVLEAISAPHRDAGG